MCLAKVYLTGQRGKVLILEEMSVLKADGRSLHMQTLFGEHKAVEGIIKEVDFQNSTITLEELVGE